MQHVTRGSVGAVKVTTAILCDYAQVRDSLLTVVAGGITRLWRPELPAELHVCLGLVVQMDAIEASRGHELGVVVLDDDGREVVKVTGNFGVQGAAVEVAEETQLPLAFDLRRAQVQVYGAHSVRVYIDGNHQHTLQFWVRPPATPPVGPDD